ncbi:MAG: hypothetical protein QOH68_1619 [Nocardioidaceae bacterium]|nr:hypothetical protein [Nocardioidaceae bacterium]
MTRRWTLLAGAIALTLSAPQAAFAAPQQPDNSSTPGADTAAADALRALKADADGAVRVQRDAEGEVAFVSSTDGQAMLDSDASGPRKSAQDQLAEYGDAFGIDGSTSKAVVTQTLDSATGGSVVRSEQVVDGVPVFGGQVVMSLDEDQGLVSVASATADATQVPAASVSQVQAQRTAVAVTARTHRARPADLTARAVGQRLYDPAIVHTSDPMGVRPVWQFEVTNGFDIRETVLVGTGRGEVALHFNDAPDVDRVVCDNAEARTLPSSSAVPLCTAPTRTETSGASGVTDTDAAFDNLGATSDTYASVDDIDLTALIGAGTPKKLMSTVRWCFTDGSCPFANAFWDGTQMVFGAGYAGADDVVGHELTHGYVERTSALFMFHQSGALNESLADTIGEIVDHRSNADPNEDNSAWQLGEDIPGGAIRSLQDPTIYDQPDTMTSPAFVNADVTYDGGAVHDNDGVGNKTAYLISQGGTFNGHTITGIDTGDPTLAKTGRLYLETIPRLTSGSEYADLGRVLVATCDELATAGTGGFTTDNCDAVREAVAATELSSPPTAVSAAAPEAPVACPTGNSQITLVRRDDDGIDGFGFSSTSPLWGRANGEGIPSYATSGTESLFGLDPAPDLGDPSSGSVTSTAFTVPVSAGGAHLNFHHAYVMDWENSTYYDGGQVVVAKLVNGTWTTVTGLPWVNGPTRHIIGSTGSGFTGFGGDSRGYGSSEVDLSSLAGQTVRVSFRVEGDPVIAFFGWWIDDVRLYTCGSPVPGAPRITASAAAPTSAKVTWQAPAYAGSGIGSYKITRSDGKTATVSSATRSATLTGFNTTVPLTVSVVAVNQTNQAGPAATTRFLATTTTTSATARAAKGKPFTITAKVVRRGMSTLVRGMPLTLQRRLVGKTAWSTLSTGSTTAKGIKTWTVRQNARTSYRVVAKGVSTWFTSTSSARTVGMR